MAEDNRLRISFIAGGLSKGGAEKQFLYMLQALEELGASFQVITLTQGEFYEDVLIQRGIQPIYAGSNPAARIITILKAVRSFRPHFLQATHFFASFYAGTAGRLAGIPSIGAIRSDLYLDLAGIGRTGPWLLRLPTVLLANSRVAQANALQMGLPAGRVHILHNVIDLDTFDRRMAATEAAAQRSTAQTGGIYAITVARLVPVKRLERFLTALALARQQVPDLTGIIVGDGPSAPELRAKAQSLGLRPDQPDGGSSGVRFLGERDDIPQLLAQANMFILTSDREGFPNVLLEAMAASLPIAATPAGETRELVVDGTNGFLVPFDDPQVLAGRLVALAQSPALRQRMGSAGRQIVERQFSYPRLKSSLVEMYRDVARQASGRYSVSSAVLYSLENALVQGSERMVSVAQSPLDHG